MIVSDLLKRFGLNLESYGYIERRKGRSIVILANDPGTIATISGFLQLIRERYPRNHMVFFAKGDAEREQLRKLFPEDRILAYPKSSGYAHARTICGLKTQLLLIVGVPDTDLERWLDQALRADTAVVMVEGLQPYLWRNTVLQRVKKAWLQKITLLVGRGYDTVTWLQETGISAAKIHRLETATSSRQQSSDLLINRLTSVLSAKKKPRIFWKLSSRISLAAIKDAALDSSFGRWLMACQYRFIDDLPSVGNHLGHPKTIMCLGNGPSSEDPELGSIDHDCLFRVNHRWQDRGILTKPDMVFTGNRGSIKAIGSGVLYGLQDTTAKHRLTFQCLGVRKRLQLTTVESLRIFEVAAFSGFRPTNGAVMLATAAALAPERLIVAGIDLFDDPGGSYPGDTKTPNAYTIGHDRDTELRFILETLGRYEGELIIHGQVLADHWRRYKMELDRSSLPQSA